MRTIAEIIDHKRPLLLPMSTCVTEACRKMREMHVDSVLVTDNKQRLAGIFTGSDACRVLADGMQAGDTTLADVMTSDPDSTSPDQSAIEAMRLMWDGGFGHVPVVKGKQVLGVISRDDFAGSEEESFDRERCLWEHMR